MLLLITPEDIRTFKTLSVNIPDERVNPFIQEAQLFDLKKVCGKAFFDKLIEPNSPQNYPELFDHYVGFLAYRSYYRLISNNQITVTANGVVYKRTEFSDQVPVADLAAIKNHILDGSKVYEQEFIDYMNAESTDAATKYPEWLESGRCACLGNRKVYGGATITAVGRPITQRYTGHGYRDTK